MFIVIGRLCCYLVHRLFVSLFATARCDRFVFRKQLLCELWTRAREYVYWESCTIIRCTKQQAAHMYDFRGCCVFLIFILMHSPRRDNLSWISGNGRGQPHIYISMWICSTTILNFNQGCWSFNVFFYQNDCISHHIHGLIWSPSGILADNNSFVSISHQFFQHQIQFRPLESDIGVRVMRSL